MRAISDSSMENGSGSGFAVGLLCGAAIGATVALLFAPKPGSALRRDVVSASDRLKRRAMQVYNGAADAVDDLSARGSEAMDDLSKRGSQVADDLSRRGSQTIDNLAARGAEAIDQGREVVEKIGARARQARTDRGD